MNRNPEFLTLKNECGDYPETCTDTAYWEEGQGHFIIHSTEVRTPGSIGVVFEGGEDEENPYLAFMGVGLFCGSHPTLEAAIGAIEIAYFG
jgi:hypothetical protein